MEHSRPRLCFNFKLDQYQNLLEGREQSGTLSYLTRKPDCDGGLGRNPQSTDVIHADGFGSAVEVESDGAAKLLFEGCVRLIVHPRAAGRAGRLQIEVGRAGG